MGIVGRLALGSILVLGAVRAATYLAYAALALGSPLETFHLESKMVLLAYRVQAGLSLYPSWEDYPHVANFFSPAYFLLVGLLGRAMSADIASLFFLGRVVSFASTLLVALVVGRVLARRFGRSAAWAGALLTLGSPCLIGFSVMVRPDLPAEFLGLAGFFLSSHPTRRGAWAGGVLLVLAVLTKQTAAVFLLASFLALLFEGRRRRAWALLAGCAAAVLVVVAVGTACFEPNLARSLLAEGKTPWSFAAWLRTLGRVATWMPDLLYFPALGLLLWSRGSSRDVRWTTLSVVVLAASLVASGKRGADLNYYLSLRVAEALAAGTLWQLAGQATTRGRRAALGLAAALGAASLVPSVLYGLSQEETSRQTARFVRMPAGRAGLQVYQRVIRLAESPQVRLLTDAGLFDLHRKERAAFGDPWLFRLMVETGRIRPDRMRRWLDEEAYDLIVTASDLNSPAYAQFEFGLPMVLVESARLHYVPIGTEAGFFFYKRRGPGAAAPAAGSGRSPR